MDYTLVTVACANVATMERTFQQIKDLRTTGHEWLVLDNGYPDSALWLIDNAGRFGYSLLHTPTKENIGLYRGFTLLLEHVKTRYVVGIDPDTIMATRNFDEALIKHFADSRNVIVSAFNEYSQFEMRSPTLERTPHGHVLIPDHPVIQMASAFDTEWLRSVGGFVGFSDLYGGSECAMWKHLDQKTRRWVFALNCVEAWKNFAPDLSDEWYREHKRQHAHLGDTRSLKQFWLDWKATK